MASTFPGSIDNFTDPLSNSSLSSPSHAGQHSDLNDAVEKIETYMGLVKVIPTAATNGTVAANGTVTIGNAVSSVTVTCFSSLYRTYLVRYDGIQTSGTNAIGLTFSGSTGSTYNDAGHYIATGTATLVAETLANAVRIRIGICEAGPTTIAGWFDCYGPNTTSFTWVNGGSMSRNYSNWRQGTDANAVSHTSFTLTPLSGTFTGGSLTVYGYRN